MIRSEYEEALAPVLRRWKSFTRDVADALWEKLEKDMPKEALVKAVKEILYGHGTILRYEPKASTIHEIARTQMVLLPRKRRRIDGVGSSGEKWAVHKRYWRDILSDDPVTQTRAGELYIEDCSRLGMALSGEMRENIRARQERLRAKIPAAAAFERELRETPEPVERVAHAEENEDDIPF